MKFEFDAEKSDANMRKHGINFAQAQALWDDDNRIELPTNFVTEQRYTVTGNIDAKLWTAAVTYRDENIRIISVRRARKKEIALYERANRETMH